MHELHYLRRGDHYRAYCVCGWIQPYWAESALVRMINMRIAQKSFIEHLEAVQTIGSNEYVS